MTAPSTAPAIGPLLRDWRQRRRLSQLDLALDAEVSTRHLSFVETGRASPSRDLVLHLAEHLDVPLRERNTLLVAAGFAPAYRATPLQSAEMLSVRAALDIVLSGHEPLPATVVDRRWDLVASNQPANEIIGEGVAEWLRQPPINTMRLALHPEGLAPRIVNFAEYSAHLLLRLKRQRAASGDHTLAELETELLALPGVGDPADADPSPRGMLFMPLVLRWGARELRFFSTIATFGTALDITVEELAIEQFFPADAETAEALRRQDRPAAVANAPSLVN